MLLHYFSESMEESKVHERSEKTEKKHKKTKKECKLWLQDAKRWKDFDVPQIKCEHCTKIIINSIVGIASNLVHVK